MRVVWKKVRTACSLAVGMLALGGCGEGRVSVSSTSKERREGRIKGGRWEMDRARQVEENHSSVNVVE